MNNFSFIAQIQRLMEAYEIVCKPLCEEFEIQMPALDILMTLADNSCGSTARDISKFKALKPNLISFHVEKLVQAGYLERQSFEGNRRSIRLVPTEKALPIIEQGQKLQSLYMKLISEGITDNEREYFHIIIKKVNTNVENIKKCAENGTLENIQSRKENFCENSEKH